MTEKPWAAMTSQSSALTGRVGSIDGTPCQYSAREFTLAPRSRTSRPSASTIRRSLEVDSGSNSTGAAAAGGVVNLYKEPARLGVDRWCALIGARSLVSGPCLVVMAGTATTIDTLDGEGRFCGGLILPGLELMRRSLARDTAALPLAAGRHAPWPRCTDDAITSGCLEAQAGAIERAFARLPGNASCLLSGGAAGAIAEHLGVPHRQVGNLVLDGLLELAGESPQAHAIGKSNG